MLGTSQIGNFGASSFGLTSRPSGDRWVHSSRTSRCSARRIDAALAVTIAEPPPTATTESAPSRSSSRTASSTTGMRTVLLHAGESPDEPVTQDRRDAIEDVRVPEHRGAAEDDRPAAPEPVQFTGQRVERARPAERPERRGDVPEVERISHRFGLG